MFRGLSEGWSGVLHASLLDLTLENAGHLFAAGLSRAIPRCCPRLEALHIGFGVLHAQVDSRLASALVKMLEAMPGLRSLSLAEGWLSAEALRALGDLPQLTALTLFQMDCSREGLEALGGRCAQLRSLSVTDMPEDALCLMLRGMSASRRLASLHLAIHNRTWADVSFATRIAPSLSVCTGGMAPLKELSIIGHVWADVVARDSAEVEALLDAASGACGTLRSLSLSGIWHHEPPFDLHALSVFRRLERLSLGHLLGSEDGRIAELVATVGAAAPELHTIHLALPTLDPLPADCLAAAELLRLRPLRVLLAGREAWSVVTAGIKAAQESRLRSCRGRRLGRSLAEALPHGVLREIAGFLSWAAPLLVTN
jgi:hypothetical protein